MVKKTFKLDELNSRNLKLEKLNLYDSKLD